MPVERCSKCGVEHEQLEPAFRLPDAVFAVRKAAQAARCAAGGRHAALVERGLDEALTAAAMEAVPATP